MPYWGLRHLLSFIHDPNDREAAFYERARADRRPNPEKKFWLAGAKPPPGAVAEMDVRFDENGEPIGYDPDTQPSTLFSTGYAMYPDGPLLPTIHSSLTKAVAKALDAAVAEFMTRWTTTDRLPVWARPGRPDARHEIIPRAEALGLVVCDFDGNGPRLYRATDARLYPLKTPEPAYYDERILISEAEREFGGWSWETVEAPAPAEPATTTEMNPDPAELPNTKVGRLARDLLDAYSKGRPPTGVDALADKFKTSRSTVNRALRELRSRHFPGWN
jgi:hypothetical protein